MITRDVNKFTSFLKFKHQNSSADIWSRFEFFFFSPKNALCRRAFTFCCLYLKLSTVQIWGKSNKFSLSYNSLKCLLQANTNYSRTDSAKKISCFASKLRRQTPSTRFSDNGSDQCRESLPPSTSGWNLRANLKKTLCISQCVQGEEIFFFVARFFLKLVWQNRRRVTVIAYYRCHAQVSKFLQNHSLLLTPFLPLDTTYIYVICRPGGPY